MLAHCDLLGLVDRFDLEVKDRRRKADLLKALMSARQVTMRGLLEALSMSALGRAAAALGIEQRPRKKTELVAAAIVVGGDASQGTSTGGSAEDSYGESAMSMVIGAVLETWEGAVVGELTAVVENYGIESIGLAHGFAGRPAAIGEGPLPVLRKYSTGGCPPAASHRPCFNAMNAEMMIADQESCLSSSRTSRRATFTQLSDTRNFSACCLIVGGVSPSLE